MSKTETKNWGMNEFSPIQGDPFEQARSSCNHALQIAQDVNIDQLAMEKFVKQLDVESVVRVADGSMGENCDTRREDFHSGEAAANFALTFCILQLGHGYRYPLHKYCGRGASKTITMGCRVLHTNGSLNASRLLSLSREDIMQAFQIPDVSELGQLIDQLQTVVVQTGNVLEKFGLEDFAGFCDKVSQAPSAAKTPAANLVQQLTCSFPAFNDQATLHDGSKVVLVKKATLAVGELNRLAAPLDSRFDFSLDYHRAVAPIDNVIPAMLVYHGILKLSPRLEDIIHQQRLPLLRGPLEAELRAVALIACEQIVAATKHKFSALNLGYFLWMEGKKAETRKFARHHTPDTVFY